MNTHTTDLSTHPPDLTLELHSVDGMVAEFYQADPECVGSVLRLLATPRLFTQPELVLASAHHASAITTRTIDVILARTRAPLPKALPLNSPAGHVDISEVEDTLPSERLSSTVREGDGQGPAGTSARIFRVEIHTLGGWASVLEVRAQVQGTAQDRRHTFAHVLHVPVIPFYLRTGGMGFLNPANLTRFTAYPPPGDLPETALPVELLRWLPSRSNRRNVSAGPPQPRQ